MIKTEFWLVRNEGGDICACEYEPFKIWTKKGKMWNMPGREGMPGWTIPFNREEKKVIPTFKIRKGRKIKILRTVTDDGKVTFERAK